MTTTGAVDPRATCSDPHPGLALPSPARRCRAEGQSMDRQGSPDALQRPGREMLTDVRDHEDHYEVEIDLPGFKKDQITLELNDGYLTVTASKGLDKDEKKEDGTYIRQERYAGVMSRTFYVGEEITEKDVTAKFEDGVLKLNVPKKEETKKLPEKHTIMIEG